MILTDWLCLTSCRTDCGARLESPTKAVVVLELIQTATGTGTGVVSYSPHVRTHADPHTRLHVRMHTRTYIHTHTHTYVRMQIHGG